MKPTTHHGSIIVRGLELSVFLGWPEAERSQPQVVTLDINLNFADTPKACVTDNLDDTACYDTLIGAIKEKTHAQPFRLLEHLGYEIYQAIKYAIPHETRINIRVAKRPPIPNLMGGVAFCYGDEAITW